MVVGSRFEGEMVGRGLMRRGEKLAGSGLIEAAWVGGGFVGKGMVRVDVMEAVGEMVMVLDSADVLRVGEMGVETVSMTVDVSVAIWEVGVETVSMIVDVSVAIGEVGTDTVSMTVTAVDV